MAKRNSQKTHDDLVAYAVRYLQKNNFGNLKADISGYQQPEKIIWSQTGKGHIPDLSGSNSKLNIFEVETADSINDEHTKDQWTLFAAYASQNDTVFWVVIPDGYSSAANQRLKELGIEAEVWTI